MADIEFTFSGGSLIPISSAKKPPFASTSLISRVTAKKHDGTAHVSDTCGLQGWMLIL
jgi:hypothetical protein